MLIPSDGAPFDETRLRSAIGTVESLTTIDRLGRGGLDIEFEVDGSSVTLMVPPNRELIYGRVSDATVRVMFQIQRAYGLPLTMRDDGGYFEFDLGSYRSADDVLREMEDV